MTGPVGHEAWGVRLGVGSSIAVEFGPPTATSGKVAHGEWHLWTMVCAWSLESGTDLIAASEDPREFIAEALEAVNGARLLAFDVSGPNGRATVTFDNAITLRLFPVTSRDYGHWVLFSPTGRALQMGPGTAWSFNPSAKRRQ